MRTVTTTYEQIRWLTEHKVTCPGCGRKRTIRRTFSQTVNPWNRNEDGRPKTRDEVIQSVKAQASAWEPSGEDLYHVKCAGAVSA